VATIKTIGVAGSTFIDIQKGTQRAPEAPSGGTIAGREPFDVADLMQQGSDLLKSTRTNIEALRHDLQAVIASARTTSEDVSEVAAQVRQGQGTIGKLLTDQKLAGSVDQLVDAARRSALNLNSASARMNDTMADLQRRDLVGRSEAMLERARLVMGAAEPSGRYLHQ
jgi:ABC-type transporter Mla subunit MlaD